MTNIIYQNYHKHSYWTNPIIADSAESLENYAQRAVDLGHSILSSVEHGWGGYYIECYELAKKYNLKFLFGAEFYWVKDRLALDENGKKDGSNNHIVIMAKNEKGRRAINKMLSESSKDPEAFYYRTRIDVGQILSLPKDDVWITSACVGFWNYGLETIDIVKQFKDYFGENFFLEVQPHYTVPQIELNKKIMAIAKKFNIKLIAGCDSHYIYEENAWERDDFMRSKGISYAEEQGWFMDYPSGNVLFERFRKQNVFSDEEILEFINNTNILCEVEEYKSDIFNTEIKMPTLYPELSQMERNKKFIKLVHDKWEEEKKNIPQELHAKYNKEILKELKTILDTNHADYFLFDYEMIQQGIRNGGVITPSGRGSAVSFYINKLLGFTKVDRISSPVPLLPERFMSTTRMLETKSLADIDMNIDNRDPFIKAHTDLVGLEHAVPMVAFGTMKVKAAWQMYAKSASIPFDIANSISKQIEEYEEYIKYHSSDEDFNVDEVDILEFIDEEYQEIFSKSAVYRGVISDWKIAPSAILVYSGNIEEEIGLVRCKKNVCCIVDKVWGDDYKFLKSDILKVSSIKLIYNVFNRIGISNEDAPDVNKLLEMCRGNDKVWDIYKNGYTMGINQVEQSGATKKIMRYKPKNISELSAFIAAIRPGFKSMYDIFESRNHFDYGIPTFDNLIQTNEMKNSFVLYQENTMQVLEFSGIPMEETYGIIKAISKKKKDKIASYKDRMVEGFSSKIMNQELLEKEQATNIALRVWQILEDSSAYSFNSAHALSMAIDSLYGAYLKANYPLEFYECFLNMLMERGEKDRAQKAIEEMKLAFGIELEDLAFGQDNRQFTVNYSTNCISDSLKAIKGFGDNVAEELYKIKDRDFFNFVDLLECLLTETDINKSQIETLIILRYFEKFGMNKKLLSIYNLYVKFGEKSQIKIEDADKYGIPPELFEKYSEKKTPKLYKNIRMKDLFYEVFDMLENKSLPIKQQALMESSRIGFVKTRNILLPDNWYYVIELKVYNNPAKPYLILYNLKTGDTIKTKIKNENIFIEQPFREKNIICVNEFKTERKTQLIDGRWKKIDETEDIVANFNVIG